MCFAAHLEIKREVSISFIDAHLFLFYRVFGVMLIIYFVNHAAPYVECHYGFVVKQLCVFYLSIFGVEAYFVVDKRVVEVDILGICFGVAVINFVEVCPVDGSQTHGTGLA